MKIETITYKRVKNLGNYQSETLEVTATVEEPEEAHIVADRCLKTLFTVNFTRL